MRSGILKHDQRNKSREALYAELRMRSLRRHDWRRLKKVALILFLLAVLGALLSYQSDAGPGSPF